MIYKNSQPFNRSNYSYREMQNIIYENATRKTYCLTTEKMKKATVIDLDKKHK